ncbi:hypothetical protein [Myroides odoratimimus]|uniref:hypothetical protein n=1 Tax=Myroides odoratimimus TaxID=76832 RepID=UPI0025765ECC|nr:hypothetical protein [Myroides odoratimimus]MDM1057896.1 hypothetical protein [Myroides odoratimimus]
MRQLLFLLTLFLSISSFSQERKIYKIENGDDINVFYTIDVPVGDNFLQINNFFDKVEWGNSQSITIYKYLGISSTGDIRVQLREINYILTKVSSDYTSELVFKTKTGETTDISVTIGSGRIKPIEIPLQITATNKGIKVKYTGTAEPYNMN